MKRDELSSSRRRLETALGELTGRSVTLDDTDGPVRAAAEASIDALFAGGLSAGQAHDHWLSVLVFYAVEPCSRAFFDRYLGAESFTSHDAFDVAVERFQRDAIRLFSTFSEAYRTLATSPDLEAVLAPIVPLGREEIAETYEARTRWTTIEEIDEVDLPNLGYIAAARVRQETHERLRLKRFLEELAHDVRHKGGSHAVQQHSESTRRTIESLMRKFDTHLPHGLFSPLFAPDADELMREAKRLAPKSEEELEKMSTIQETAQRNLAHYLTADYLDIYVATSMRSNADFVSVNRFVRALFAQPRIAPLKLRAFNPTQSWIDDRIGKGLVEALMLRRAQITIYMAQKTDTFGKDSEASVSLGQGKPVIVYVPKLAVPGTEIDSEALGRMARPQLLDTLASLGYDGDIESYDDEGLIGRLLSGWLTAADDAKLTAVVRAVWADYDLYEEASRILDDDSETQEENRASYRQWLDTVTGGEDAPIPAVWRPALIGILVANTLRFERRAKVFREIHPLALQVILSSGVLNGILVVRSVEECADVLANLIANDLDLELHVDDDNYRLVETITGSTIRVISRNDLLQSAFEAQNSRERRR